MQALLPFLRLQRQLNPISCSVTMATSTKTPKEPTGRGQRTTAGRKADNQHVLTWILGLLTEKDYCDPL